MSKQDFRKKVIEVINEVRRLHGYNTIGQIDDDKYGLVLLRLLNQVVKYISDKGDWLEQYRETTVTAVTSTFEYSLGINEPLKRIYEISFSGDARSLYPISIEKFNQYNRVGGTGRPRFFALKNIDSQGVPKFVVHRQPGTNENGNKFTVCYFVEERLYDVNSANTLIPFPADLVIQGLYAASIAEQTGSLTSKEYTIEQLKFEDMRKEALNKFTVDTGVDTQIMPE